MNCTIRVALRIFALLIIGVLGIRGWRDFDYSWDTSWYHLPYAARILGFIPEELYRFENLLEHRWLGAPILGELLQGLLWQLFGRPEAINFLNLGALCAFVVVIRWYSKASAALLILSFLSAPTILIHSTSGYIDVLANLGAAGAGIVTWRSFVDRKLPSYRSSALLLVFSFVAVQTKLLMVPVVFAFQFLYGALLLWRTLKLHRTKEVLPYLHFFAFIALLPVAHLQPVMNLVAFGNPFFPYQAAIGDLVLFAGTPERYWGPEYLRDSLPSTRWFLSVVEYQLPAFQWSIDQLTQSSVDAEYGMGGYFSWYVLLACSLLAYLLTQVDKREKLCTAAFFAITTLLAANLPQSNLLRYYSFWFVLILSANGILIARKQFEGLYSAYALLVVGVFLTVNVATQGKHLLPRNRPWTDLVARVQSDWSPKGKTGQFCLVGGAPYTFYHAAFFHDDEEYSLTAALSPSECRRGRSVLLPSRRFFAE